MRNIKFRCWNAHSSVMHDWDEMVSKNKINLLSHQQKSYPVMQFTGLLDINGIEIYEGDIVSMPYVDPMGGIQLDQQDFKSEVSFDRGSFLVFCNELRPEMHAIENWIKRTEGKYVSNYGNIKEWGDCVLTVIGNIHQNPELLK